MSLGPGTVMRAALRTLQQAGELLESQEVARQVFGYATIADVPPSRAASVRRALRTLVRRGEIEELGRDWEGGRRKWGTHAEADKKRARTAQFHAFMARREAEQLAKQASKVEVR
ncbi:hypothetical protein [Deinococcus marmoris]|uniref:hypothetical protein n=1 Tax=Deinococcus marmoris TaxID=249408 RepID=UPI000559918E|nr:hypothetical protein [Deinococcus marmoris]